MRAAIYARVSTEGQLDGHSIAAQINEVTEYARKSKIEIYKMYVDEGISGTKENRPEFQKMIKDAEQKLFDVILVHKFDRFARSVEISSKIKTRLRRVGVNIISITEPVEDSPIGFFSEGLMALMSEYFVKNLAREVKKGQKQRVLEGLPSGTVPYGYYHKDKKIYIDEEKAKIVRLIFQMYSEGKGFMAIAIWLNENRIPSPKDGTWKNFHIARLIKKRLYIGEIQYAKEYYPSSVPPIVPLELYEAANRMNGVKAETYNYKTSNKDKFLFAGRLVCRECNHRLTLHRTTEKGTYYWYYYCHVGKNYDRRNRCTVKKYIKAAKLEKLILDHIKSFMRHRTVKVNAPVEPIYEIISGRKDKILEELERAKAAYIRSVFSLDEYTQIKQKLEDELAFVESEGLNTTPKTIDIKPLIKNMLEEFNACEKGDIVARKVVLQKYIERIYYLPDSIDIAWVRSRPC
jgi:DNA invertase Pin-like site-specific DNA recombinase